MSRSSHPGTDVRAVFVEKAAFVLRWATEGRDLDGHAGFHCSDSFRAAVDELALLTIDETIGLTPSSPNGIEPSASIQVAMVRTVFLHLGGDRREACACTSIPYRSGRCGLRQPATVGENMGWILEKNHRKSILFWSPPRSGQPSSTSGTSSGELFVL